APDAWPGAPGIGLQESDGHHVAQARLPCAGAGAGAFVFDGEDLGEIFNVDLLVNESQLLTYLKLADKKLAYLINFNVPLLKQGFHRYVRNW
ncbi:MAG: hypothetical protein EOO12_12465, partial [Chitinophagaceae bacterium]